MQPIPFRSLEDFLAYLPEEEFRLVQALRRIVRSCMPEAEEKLAYNVPFYYRHARICYIWPASVPWGGLQQGVALGFCKGALLRDEIHYLEKRKETATKVFKQIADIDEDLVKAYLYEAIELDK
ncbi:MAG: DUF1801 domain-containing protein [Adhaeribacter sp.]